VDKYREVLASKRPTIWDIFERSTRVPQYKPAGLLTRRAIRSCGKIEGGGSVDLIPSRLELAFSLKNPAKKEIELARALSEVEHKYDLILVDCPPTESILTTAAYFACNRILVPVKPDYLSSIGLSLLVRSLDDFHSEHEIDGPKLAGIAFCATSDYAPEEVRTKAEVRSFARSRGWYVFENEIRYSRSYPRSAREGQPIFWTNYVRQFQKRGFLHFATEVAERIGLQ
jgi:chromosome partitioning protein